jgi:hypothetical protein
MKRFVSLHSLSLRQSVGILGRDQPIAKPLPNTNTDIHASSGIRTHDPSVREGKRVHALDRAATVIGI